MDMIKHLFSQKCKQMSKVYDRLCQIEVIWKFDFLVTNSEQFPMMDYMRIK